MEARGLRAARLFWRPRIDEGRGVWYDRGKEIIMAQITVDAALVKEAAIRYPRHSPEEITAEALKSYLAYAELLEMKGILTDDDLWEDAYDRGEPEYLQ
jgi:hypothetical protein